MATGAHIHPEITEPCDTYRFTLRSFGATITVAGRTSPRLGRASAVDTISAWLGATPGRMIFPLYRDCVAGSRPGIGS
jgi:hypothetical protein